MGYYIGIQICTDVAVERGDEHERTVEVLLDHRDVRLDPHRAVFCKAASGVAEDAGRLDHVTGGLSVLVCIQLLLV